MQIIPLVLALLVTGAFPSSAKTSWMEPAAFRLEIGMARADVEKRIEEAGLETTPGKYPRLLVVRYAENKTLTLGFVEDHLQSLRFEFVDFIPSVRSAGVERVEALEAALGKGSEMSGGVILFDKHMPNVMLVLSTKHDDSFGRQGLGFLSVRYYDPSAEKILP
ncbi:MAG: hypothetical protein ACSLFQ_02510 [Thermoanaerobaculia bacterium]